MNSDTEEMSALVPIKGREEKKQTDRFVFFMNSVLLFAHRILCEAILKLKSVVFFFRPTPKLVCMCRKCVHSVSDKRHSFIKWPDSLALVLCHKNASALQFIKLIYIYCTFVLQNGIHFVRVMFYVSQKMTWTLCDDAFYVSEMVFCLVHIANENNALILPCKIST